MALLTLSPINARRWRNFKANRRALWSLWVFSVLFVMSLFAEFLAYDKPILVNYRGQYYAPIWNFYPETEFGGDFQTEAVYRDPEVRCLIASGGLEDCFDDPEGIVSEIDAGTFAAEGFQEGWAIWPVIPYSFDTAVERPGAAPLPPNGQNWLGTDATKRDVMARVIHGFRLSILFTLIVTGLASIIGVAAGAVQGYFGGWIDLVFQRIIEIWTSTPQLYVIIIMFAILGRSFWLLGVSHGALWLDVACRRCASRVLAGAQPRVCPRGQGTWRGQHNDYVPSYAAQCDGCDADDAAVYCDRDDLVLGGAGLSRLWPAFERAEPWRADASGQAEP